MMHWIRRTHLYLGLLLFPWAILYGVTAFLFNHPMALNDQPMEAFSADDLRETPLGALPAAEDLAAEVVQKLNEQQKPETKYQLLGNSRFAANQFAFAVVESDSRTIRLLFDLSHQSGTIREEPRPSTPASSQPAPFAVTPGSPAPQSTATPNGSSSAGNVAGADGVVLENPIQRRIEETIPVLLKRKGFPDGSAKVTSIPPLQFEMKADGKTWLVNYLPMTGAVSGVVSTENHKAPLSLRQFLLRLHLTHGFPSEMNTRWFWAIVVDLMAFTMCFWGISGLAMWWQIKRTRRLGQIVVGVSFVIALLLTFGMYSLLMS